MSQSNCLSYLQYSTWATLLAGMLCLHGGRASRLNFHSNLPLAVAIHLQSMSLYSSS